MPTLIIANKAYSSWSLRPWLAMRQGGIAFDEIVIPLDQPDTAARIAEHSPAGKVPVLKDGGITVWDSLSILEYLAETYPEAGLWPQDRAARAYARTISAEMHSGFLALRKAMPMNVRKRFAYRDRGHDVARDIVRIVEIWRDCRTRFGQGGPFLFGSFTAADAMYAPVVSRFDTYQVPVEPVVRPYMDSILGLPAMVDWRAAAMREEWVIAADEVDEPALPA